MILGDYVMDVQIRKPWEVPSRIRSNYLARVWVIEGDSWKRANVRRGRKERKCLVPVKNQIVPYFRCSKEKLRLESLKFTEY